FGEAGPALVHNMIVGKRNDLDAVGFERFRQGDRGVEHKRLRSVRVGRGDRRFEVDEAEVSAAKDVAYLAQEGAPTLAAFAGSRGGGADRLMRNDVSSNGKADLGHVMGQRGNGRGSTGVG